jgi:hypothetical protein
VPDIESPDDEKSEREDENWQTTEIPQKGWGKLSFSPQSYGFRTGAAESYQKVPRELAEIADRHKIAMWQWRIELHGLKPGEPPLGYDIFGNVIIGRAVDGSEADIDLEPYDALAKGVSRQHAMIRPTKQRLFLIDLSSTNGVRHNEIPTGPGMAVTLRNGDIVTLGDLTFEIQIIGQPDANDGDDRNALLQSGTRPLPDRP